MELQRIKEKKTDKEFLIDQTRNKKLPGFLCAQSSDVNHTQQSLNPSEENSLQSYLSRKSVAVGDTLSPLCFCEGIVLTIFACVHKNNGCLTGWLVCLSDRSLLGWNGTR